MLKSDGSAHGDYHVSLTPGAGATVWADASSPPELMRAALDEHADLLYSLGAP